MGEFDGHAYFTMEFVDGGSLAQMLAGVPLPSAKAVTLSITFAEAMEAGYLAAAAARGANPTISGIVRIGAPDGVGTWFLAPRIHRLAQAHPKLEIELVVTARAFSLSRRALSRRCSRSVSTGGRGGSARWPELRISRYSGCLLT